MRRTASLIATAALLSAPVLVLSTSAAHAGGGHQDGNDGKVCLELDSGKIDTNDEPGSVTITAPEGSLIDGYCVKAGSANSGDGPRYFDVEPTAELTISYPGGKAISHYSYSYSAAPSESPTPGTEEPTPTPTTAARR